jgi:iron complex outermembrane recepter protein
MVGKWWLRVPRSRATLQASYRPTPAWMVSAGLRHEGRSYNDTYNLDIQPQVFGASSKINQLDLRAACKVNTLLELALGVNNLTDQRAFAFHPFPGRTVFAELRFKR